jgi:hypothetical protein
MKDIGASIRSIYSTLLAGITYGGNSVPFYDAEPLVTTPDNYIVLNAMDQSDANNDQRFVSEVIVTLDVVTKANMLNSRAAVDAISNSVLQALLPNQYIDHEDADFQIMITRARSPGYIHTQDGTVHINRKILRIVNRLNQQ